MEKKVSKKRHLIRTPILIIDDDICWRKVVEHNLSLSDFEIYTAADGPTGIEAALKHKPRLILLDVMMPVMDGLQVLATLKRDPRTTDIPVIMLTAKGAVGDIDRAFEIGAEDYITKPFEGKKFEKTIKEKLQKLRKQSLLPQL
jgi:CheY-like chemotaxis protein